MSKTRCTYKTVEKLGLTTQRLRLTSVGANTLCLHKNSRRSHNCTRSLQSHHYFISFISLLFFLFLSE